MEKNDFIRLLNPVPLPVPEPLPALFARIS